MKTKLILPISSEEDNTSNWILDGEKVEPKACKVLDEYISGKNFKNKQ